MCSANSCDIAFEACRALVAQDSNMLFMFIVMLLSFKLSSSIYVLSLSLSRSTFAARLALLSSASLPESLSLSLSSLTTTTSSCNNKLNLIKSYCQQRLFNSILETVILANSIRRAARKQVSDKSKSANSFNLKRANWNVAINSLSSCTCYFSCRRSGIISCCCCWLLHCLFTPALLRSFLTIIKLFLLLFAAPE